MCKLSLLSTVSCYWVPVVLWWLVLTQVSVVLWSTLWRVSDDLVLKPKQVEVLEAVYTGSDCFVLLDMAKAFTINCCHSCLTSGVAVPTPKTQIYRYYVIVISPHPVSSLHSRGVSAAILSGNTCVDKQYLASEADIKSGCFRFLYSCPEAVVGSDTVRVRNFAAIHFRVFSKICA